MKDVYFSEWNGRLSSFCEISCFNCDVVKDSCLELHELSHLTFM